MEQTEDASVALSARVPREIAEKVKRLAAMEDRTVSYWLARLIREAVQKKRTN